MGEKIDVEDTPPDYRTFVKTCLPEKKVEGLNPQEAMKACGSDWRTLKGEAEPGGEEIPHEEGEEGLKGQLYLVGGEDCVACDEAKEHFKEDLETGTIKLVTIDDDKGWDIIRTLRLAEIPTLVLEKENGSFCRVGEDGKIESCFLPKIEEEKSE